MGHFDDDMFLSCAVAGRKGLSSNQEVEKGERKRRTSI
jgi:hypothetical protein